MSRIRAYYDFRRDKGLDAFLIDETTWNDLDLDGVFKRINPRRCTSGEQYLYYMLRSPAVDEVDYEKRKKLIDYALTDSERRLRVETILARLGCTRRADLCGAFSPAGHGWGKLAFYLTLLLLFTLSLIGAALHVGIGVRAVPVALFLNVYVHEFGKRRAQGEYDTVNYVVNMIDAVKKLRKLRDQELDRQMQPAYESLDRLQAMVRIGGISASMDSGGVADAIVTATLLDLITFEFLTHKLSCCHDDVFTIHEHLGRLDAAISIASYRAGLDHGVEPLLHFDRTAYPGIHAENLVHPLLAKAVPNDWITERPILITGSNASGKSTYLKTVALAAIMAQGICTVLGTSYEGCAFRVFSSMALSDNLSAGESCYVVETRSLKRMLNAASGEGPILCVIDEILRGTNTVERIAASCEVLKAMAEAGLLCIAATHDVELCGLLGDHFALYHFEERMVGGEMLFDYRVRAGKATSRNAIELLRLIGFDRELVERAHARAERYWKTGTWYP